MADTDMAYVSRCPKGHFVGVTVDRPEYIKDTAATVASWLRHGASIQRMTVAEARPLIDISDAHAVECLGRKPRKTKAVKQAALEVSDG